MTSEEKSKSTNSTPPKPAHKCVCGDKIASYKESLQRLQAEFENFKKRAEKESQQQILKGQYDFIAGMLPILDSFEQALISKASDETKKSLEILYAQFYSALESEGLRKMEALGKECDPYYHDVLMQKPSNKNNIILEVFQTGYMLNDSVLRHAKVKIGKEVTK